MRRKPRGGRRLALHWRRRRALQRGAKMVEAAGIEPAWVRYSTQ